MKHKFLIATVLISLSGFATPAQAGVLEFFFPMLKKQEPDPSLTLEAPFAQKKAGPPVKVIPGAPLPAPAARPLPENAVALEKAHRSGQQIAAWVAPVVAEALNFASADFKTDLAATEKYFEPSGRAQYTAFLQDQNILAILEQGQFSLRSYVRDVPVLLNEGPAGGRYHWLFEVPVVVSTLDKRVTDYKKANATNQLFMLRVQVGRSAQTLDPAGVTIEHWTGSAVKAPSQ
jgi:hypothetical protein